MKNSRGFIGLLFMLFGLAVLAYVIWQMNLSVQSGPAGNNPQTDLQVLDMAKDLKTSVEARYR